VSKTAPVIGRCIYCPYSGPDLSTEHIIPKGLLPRGVEPWLLYKASCAACRAVTSAFERVLLQGLLSPIRAALDLSSYRRKQRPTRFPIRIIRNGAEVEIMVPAKEYPALLMLPIFLPPAHLDGRQYQSGADVARLHGVRCTSIDPDHVATQYGGTLRVRGTFDLAAFSRLLLKVAYGFVVGYVGLQAIENVYALDTIMGRNRDFSRWLGNDGALILGQDSFHSAACNILAPRDIVVRLRLFGAPAPEYVAIIGRATGAAVAAWPQLPAK
jgi:hypothetical protein